MPFKVKRNEYLDQEITMRWFVSDGKSSYIHKNGKVVKNTAYWFQKRADARNALKIFQTPIDRPETPVIIKTDNGGSGLREYLKNRRINDERCAS